MLRIVCFIKIYIAYLIDFNNLLFKQSFLLLKHHKNAKQTKLWPDHSPE